MMSEKLRLVLLFVALEIFLTAALWLGKQHHLDSHLKERMETIEAVYRSTLNGYQLLIEQLVDHDLKTPEIIDLLRGSHSVYLPPATSEALHQELNKLRKVRAPLHVLEFNLLSREGDLLATSQQPNYQRGSSDTTHRTTMQALARAEAQYGFKNTQGRHAFHAFHPLWNKDVLVGAAEIGFDARAILESMNQAMAPYQAEHHFIADTRPDHHIAHESDVSSSLAVSVDLLLHKELDGDPAVREGLSKRQPFAIAQSSGNSTWSTVFLPVNALDDDTTDFLVSHIQEPDNILWPPIIFWLQLIGTLLILLLLTLYRNGRADRHKALSISARLQLVTDQLGEGLYLSDRNGTITYANTASAHMLGYELEDFVGRKISELFQDSSGISGSSSYTTTQRHIDNLGYFKSDDIHLLHRMGLAVPVSMTVKRATEGNGTPLDITVFRDITAQKLAQEELKLRNSALQAAADAILITDNKAHIQWCNQAFTELTGYTLDEAYGQTPRILYSGENPPAVYQQLWQTIFSHKPWSGEMINRHKDGHAYHEEQTITPLVNDQGIISHFIAIKRDISERKRAEQALEQANQRNKLILESIGEGLFGVDLKGKITFINPAALAMLGYSHGEIIGQDASILTHRAKKYASRPVNSQVYGVLQDSQPRRNDNESFWNKNGSTIPVEYYSAPIIDNGETTGAVVVFRDITIRLEAQRAAQASRRAAEEMARTKSDFLAKMSHEIRTPMNGVLGMLELLSDTQPSTEQHEYLEVAKSAADSLLSIINDVLDFSRIESGKLELEYIDFNLQQTLEDAVALMSQRAHNKGIELAEFIPDNIPLMVKGDPYRLRQVLSNLISNAIKFTGQGEVVLTAALKQTTEDRREVRFEIRDTGIGIAPEHQKHLFESFRQAHSAITGRYGGTGLGLAITKELVEKMGGQIGLHSVPGEGTIFWFEIPFRIGEQQAQPVVSPQIDKRLSELHVLVIDDNTTNLNILTSYLGQWKISCLAESSGPQALQRLETLAAQDQLPDIVLLDAQMPHMDGLELSRRLSADERFDNIPCIMLSSLGSELKAAALESGCSIYLNKPVRKGILKDALISMAGIEPEIPEQHDKDENKPRPQFEARLLLVEDNIVNRMVAIGLLARYGLTPDIASDGQEAIDMLTATDYDLVFMDCQLPILDGFAATRIFRSHEATQDDPARTPVVALTASALKSDQERCYAAGMDDYLSKPFDMEQLELILTRWLSRQPEDADKGQPTGRKGTVQRTTHPSTTEAPLIDEAALASMQDLMEEAFPVLVSSFIVETADLIAQLREALADKTFATAERCAHSIKSGAANLGAKQLSTTAERLEASCRDKDANEANRLLSHLAEAYDLVEERLQPLIQQE